MDDLVYVYTDVNDVIYEIEFEPRGEFSQYKLFIITQKKAQNVINLRKQWKQTPDIKKIKYFLIDDVDTFVLEKAIYVYYNLETNAIHSISPSAQSHLDENEILDHGILRINSLIKEFISGTKNMINYDVSVNNSYVYIEEKKHDTYNFFDNISLLDDYIYATDENKTNYRMVISYDGAMLRIKYIHGDDTKKTYQLFFTNKTNKTILYDSVSFNFLNDSELEIPLELPKDYAMISSINNQIKFIEYDFLDNLPLLKKYTIDENNDNFYIVISYDGTMLKITDINDRCDNKNHQLFIISKTDKTKIYETISFNFSYGPIKEIPIILPTDYDIITSLKDQIKFYRIEQ